jgi:predicted O-methyltransferase YrrM
MYSTFTLAKKYIHYWVSASNTKGHQMHSPFVFDFIKNVLNDNRNFYAFDEIETQRKLLIKDGTKIDIEDFGAGSSKTTSNKRSIAAIAKNSLKPKKYSQLLFKIVNYYKPNTLLELGTSLGITSAYLASANSAANLITIEGSSEIAKVAAKNFETLQIKNVALHVGNFDNILPNILNSIDTIDLAFIDGNHKYQPTINYFYKILEKSNNHTIIILDDIYWSKEMEEAWQHIKNEPMVTATIDLFFIGLVVINTSFKQKQHFKIRY